MRYVLGPTFEATAPVAPAVPPAPQDGAAPAAPVKTDVAVTLLGVDEKAWTASVRIPAYSLATSNKLCEIRPYLIPVGAARPVDANGYVQSAYPFESADVSTVQEGIDATIPLPAAPPGKHLGQLVLGFES